MGWKLIYSVVIKMPPETLFNKVSMASRFPESMWPGMERVDIVVLTILGDDAEHQGTLRHYSVDFAEDGLLFSFLNKDAPLMFKLSVET